MFEENQSYENRFEDRSFFDRFAQNLTDFLQKEVNRNYLILNQFNKGVKKEISKAELNRQLKNLNLGFQLLDQILPYQLSENEWNETGKEIENAIGIINTLPIDGEIFPLTLKKILEISDMTLFHIYQAGRLLYSQNKFEQSSDIFRILVILNPLVPDFWLAFGLSLQNNHKHSDAIYAYGASILLGDNPAPHIYLAECYLVLDDPEAASIQLEEAKLLIRKKKTQEWDNLIKRITDRLKLPTS